MIITIDAMFLAANNMRYTYRVQAGEQRFMFVRTLFLSLTRSKRAAILRDAHRELWTHIHATLDAQSSNSESL